MYPYFFADFREDAGYWNGVNSNGLASCKRFNIVYEEERKTFGKDENR